MYMYMCIGAIGTQPDRTRGGRSTPRGWHSHIQLQHTATHCNTSQHTVTYCTTLQHATPHQNNHTASRELSILFTLSTAFLLYPLSIHSLFTLYSLSIHSLFTLYSLSIHSLFLLYSVSFLLKPVTIHSLFTPSIVFTLYSLSIHSLSY